MPLPVGSSHRNLIMVLDKTYPKLEVRNSKSPDFGLTERELFFKLGQRSVVDSLLEALKTNSNKEEL